MKHLCNHEHIVRQDDRWLCKDCASFIKIGYQTELEEAVEDALSLCEE